MNPETKEEDIFYTTGELLALAQDFEALLAREDQVDMDIYVYGRGVAPSLFRGSNYQIKPNFKAIYGE